MRSSLNLFKSLAESQGLEVDFENLSAEDREYILATAHQRYVQTSALIGTPASCLSIVENLRSIGVDEIGCFIDFGIESTHVLSHLPHLNRLRERAQGEASDHKGLITVPLTENQQQIWHFAQRSANALVAHNEAISFDLYGTLRTDVLFQALQQVVDRHEALRSMSRDDSQQILSSRKLDVPVLDFSNEPSHEREALVSAWIREESRRPFNLSQGPLLRINLLKLEAQHHQLLFVFHHIITDGWSLNLILEEISTIYTALCQETPRKLADSVPYRTTIDWQSQPSQRERMTQHEAYWLSQFSDTVPTLTLPTDHPRTPALTFNASIQRGQFSPQLYHDLKQFSQAQGSTLFMTLFSAYTFWLHRLTGQEDFIVAISGAARSQPGSERIVGFCANVLPIRSRLEKNSTFSDHLKRVKRALLDAYQHQAYPFARMTERLIQDGKGNLLKAIPTIFNAEPFSAPNMQALKTKLTLQTQTTEYEIALYLFESPEGLDWVCLYREELFDSVSCAAMLAEFQSVLTTVVLQGQAKRTR